MKSWLYSTALAVSVALVPIIAHAQNESGRPPSPPRVLGGAEAVAGNIASNLKLISTLIERKRNNLNLAAGSYWMDANHNISCPASPAGNCVIEVTINVQASSQSAANNRVSVCPYFDGSVSTPTGLCPYVGTAQVGRYEAFNFPWAKYGVTPGIHQLRSAAIFEFAAALGYVEIKYEVYK